MSYMHYLPWVGKAYASGYKNGKRLLILAESHYGDVRRIATRYWTKRHFSKSSAGFWTTIERVIEGHNLDKSARRAFWERVAFSNIIQESLDSAGVAPTESQWRRGRRAFREIIFWTRPDLIFVFSKRGFTRIPDRTEFPGSRELVLISPNKEPAYMYFIEPGYKILAGSFNHPRRMIYRRDQWHKWARTLVAAAPSSKRPRSFSSAPVRLCPLHIRSKLRGVRR